MIYNGVYLRDCQTLSFEQTIQYDDSGTDTLFSRFKIRVASNVVAVRYGSSRQFGIQPVNGATSVQRMHDIQERLSQPRGDFWFIVEDCVDNERGNSPIVRDQPLLIATGKAYDEEIVTTTSGHAGIGIETIESVERTDRMLRPHPGRPAGDDLSTSTYGPFNVDFKASLVLDCENGPKPKSVNVQQIIGGRSLRVEFEIEICRKLCPSDFVDEKPIALGGIADETANPNVLSNRWYLDESKDDNWVTTRTMQGTLRVANRDAWPHAMRYLCIPGLLKGYQRARQSFASDEAGLKLKYRIEDRQAHAAPPYPAIKWSGHHAESASGAMGLKTGFDFRIKLQGPPGCDKIALIGAAGKVACDRIRGLRSDLIDEKVILKNAVVMDAMDQPVIELRVQGEYTKHDYKTLGLRIKKMGEPLVGLDPEGKDSGDDPYVIDGYKPDVWPVPLAYDSPTPAGIFNCYLQNPCSVWHGMPGGWNPESQPIPDGSNPVPEDKDGGEPYQGYHSSQGEALFGVTSSYTPQFLPEDETSYQTDEDIYAHPYSFVEVQQRYAINRGWVTMPLATTDEDLDRTSALIQLHAPSAMRVLTVTASRDGKPPMMPDMKPELTDHNGNREVLSRLDVVSKSPELGADGRSRIFNVEVSCYYLLEKAPKLTDKLRGSSSPLDLFSPDQHMLDLAQLADSEGHLQYDPNITTQYPPAAEA
ncbi:MAG: hypothetical protein ACF788_03970 [Novipirellula sp. JB048]